MPRDKTIHNIDQPLNGTLSRIKWATEIQAIAQSGLTFSQDVYDQQRYQDLLNIAAEMLASCSQETKDFILNLFHQQAGYATPKIDVRGAVFKGNDVLLVQERSDQKWTLPGGWADVNQSPAFCVQKEILEESGFTVQVKKLVGLLDKRKHSHPSEWPHAYKCFFLCELTAGQAKTSVETCAVSFFPITKLPILSLPRVTAEQIKRCYQHYLDPSIPTDFD